MILQMFNKYNLLGMLWAMLIMLLCGLPGNSLPSLHFWSFLPIDKMVHFTLYTVLIVLLVHGFRKQTNNVVLSKNAYLIAISFGILYGILIEFLQATVFVGRGAEFKDVLANTAGCFMGAYLINIYLKRKSLTK
jgi:VanZ family protein